MEEIKRKVAVLSAANNAHTIRIVNGLYEKGMEVILISLKNHMNKNYHGRINEKIKIFYLPISGKKGYYLNAYFLNSFLEKIKPDIINVHYAAGYGTLGRFIKFKNKILNIWGSDIFIYPKKNIINKKIIIKNLNSYKGLATTSYCMKEEVEKYVKQKVYITPFGIDTSKFISKIKKEKKKSIKIGITKNLKKIYGIDYLIKGFAKLVNEFKNKKIELYIYGEGEYKKELKKIVEYLNIKEKVFFEGYIQNLELPEKIQEIDIMCFPSLSESFGVSALESMSCRVPTIVSDASGFLEIIENEKNGIVIKRNSEDEIYKALKKLILNSKLYEEISKNSREHIVEKYSLEKSIENFISMYEEIINLK